MTPHRGGGDDVFLRAFETLGQHAHLAALVARTRVVTREMLASRRSAFGGPKETKDTGVTDPDLETGATPLGNAVAVLDRGPETEDERLLAAALFAHTLAQDWPVPAAAPAPTSASDGEKQRASDLLWLATHTPFDATPLIDHALAQAADTVWLAIADRLRRIDAHGLPELGRGEALLGCIALASSSSAAAADLVSALLGELRDPAFLRALSVPVSLVAAAPGASGRLHGELVPAPRGWIATTALALSGILFVFHGVRLLARFALAYRCPAEVTLSADGVRVDSRVELLGRTLREKSTVIGREGLVRAVRDVRYPGIAFYAGLLSLAIGTYFGISTAVDGVRAASPSLLLVGLLLVAAGIGLDFLMSSIVPGTRGRCRIVFVPRRGPSLCVGSVDIESAEGALGTIAR